MAVRPATDSASSAASPVDRAESGQERPAVSTTGVSREETPRGTPAPVTGAQLWAVLHAYAGPAAFVVGVVLSVLGWYGVSGQAVVAEQIPYLASASIPGAALIVAGAVLFAAGRGAPGAGMGTDETARRIADLHALLVEAVPVAAEAASGGRAGETTASGTTAANPTTTGAATCGDAGPAEGTLWAIPQGTHYHRAACPLLAGKVDAYPLDDGSAAHPELLPCPVCAPPETGAPAGDAPAAD